MDEKINNSLDGLVNCGLMSSYIMVIESKIDGMDKKFRLTYEGMQNGPIFNSMEDLKQWLDKNPIPLKILNS